MYPSHLGPGDRVDFVEPPDDGPILGYSHQVVAMKMRQRHLEDDRPIPERTNLYGYVMNNPVNLVDPTGLIAAECPWYFNFHPFLECICSQADRGAPFHRGGGSIAHCVAHCGIARYCNPIQLLSLPGWLLNRIFRALGLPTNSVLVPGTIPLSQLTGLVFEILGWDPVDSPKDLKANAIGLACSATPCTCETCCKSKSAFNP